MTMSLIRIPLMLLLIYGAMVVWMWVRQEAHLFRPNHWDPLPEYESYRWDRTINGVSHQGWFLDKGAEKTVIYHGGNAEDMAGHCEVLFNGLEANALLMNYRGYGQSDGEPGEKEMVSDAIAIVNLFCQEKNVEPSSIFLMGRSLGTGVAIQVAAAQPDVAGIILVTPYESIAAIAKFQHPWLYPWLPIKRMLRHPFRSINYAPDLKIPALIFLAEYDKVIPVESGRNLGEAWGGPTEILTLPMSHNDIHETPAYFEAINRFVSGEQEPTQSTFQSE